jgi:hypothetical protein
VSEFRWEAQPRVERGVAQWTSSGLPLQLVTIGLLPAGGAPGERDERPERAPVLWNLGPGEARELAFCVLELAELAERRTEARDEPA